MKPAGIVSLAVRYPERLVDNDTWRPGHPELVAAAEESSLGRLWSPGGRELRFDRAMAPYLADPFRGARERRWLALAVLATAQFMVFLDETVVNVALPSIKGDLGFSQGTLAWVVSAYIVVFGGLVLLGGRVADLFGRRRMFLIGTAVFGMASLLDGLAQTQAMLLAARALQGVGAALATVAESERGAVRRLIDRKDAGGLARAAPGVLATLPFLLGRAEVLDRAAAAVRGTPAAEHAVERLREIDAALSADQRRHVVYDFGEVRGLDYYTGVHFEAFVAGAGAAIGAGGRYDDLMERFGRPLPAVGFALDIDALVESAA